MKKYEYLIFNLVIIIGPLLSIALIRNIITPKPMPFFLAVIISASVFIVHDQLVTGRFWNFNPKHVLGFYLGKLPVEECLFFLTVPSACLILWLNFSSLWKEEKINFFIIPIVLFFILIFFIISVQKKLWYTASVTAGFLLMILLDLIIGPTLINQQRFWVFMIMVNFLTLLFNGFLVNRPVVTYNPKLKTNWQIINIPVEDFLYGMNLIYLNIFLYQLFNHFFPL